MLYRELVAVVCGHYMEHVSTQCGLNAELCYDKCGDKYTNN